MVRRPVAAVVIAPMIMLALAACGGGSSSSASGSAAAPTGSGYGGRGGGGQNSAQFKQMQDCLTAAGISVPTPSARPSGSAGARPSFSPGAQPSGGYQGNGGGGFGGGMSEIFQSKQAQAALKACGLTVPTGRPTASPTAS